MASFTVELPLVPSLNNAFGNASRGRFLTKHAQDWKSEAGWIVKLANPPRIPGAYKLTVLVPSGMAGDCDNRIKLASDLMVELRVTPDDRKAVEVTCRRDHAVSDGKCVVTVESVEP